MYQHHRESIEKATEKLKKEAGVLAIIVGGSIAHGFEQRGSDIDLMIVVSEEEYLSRSKENRLHYFNDQLCTYQGGYIDGKYISLDLMEKTAQIGSEPARFAFEGALVTYSKLDEVEKLLKSIPQYPVALKQERINRFYAQLEAWKWYCAEAIKQDNTYLLHQAVTKLILFGGRMVLAHNQTLYPYHKWFLKVLARVKNKPEQLMVRIDQLLKDHSAEKIELFYRSIVDFTDWGVAAVQWQNLFVKDSELNWLDGAPPIADI